MAKGRQALTEDDIKSSIVIGERIAKGRKAINLKQKELADLVGVTTDTIRNWEKGRSRPSRPEDFEELSKALELPVPYLMNVDGKYQNIINDSKSILESFNPDDKNLLLERLLLKMGYFPDSIDPNFNKYMMKRICDAMEDYKLLNNDKAINPYQFNMTMEHYGMDVSLPENQPRNSTNITSAEHIRREIEFQESKRKDDEK